MTTDLPLRVLDLAAVTRWAYRARGALGEYRRRIDDLNVFPVPDGDTGTNLYLTLHSALEALERDTGADGRSGLAAGADGLARRILLGARGNSGVILGLLVRGLAEGLDDGDDVGGAGLARAVDRANTQAWRGVSSPVEGTILSVSQAVAEAAMAAARQGRDLAGVVDATLAAARAALARTPEQLDSLARAGVVDAGGAGLVVILAALGEVVTGEPVRVDLPRRDPGNGPGPAPDAAPGEGDSAHVYEVMYLLERCTDDGADRLTTRLGEVGDSVVVAGDEALRTVHVHTEDAGAAVEAALPLGWVHGLRITCLTGGSEPAEGRAFGESLEGVAAEPAGVQVVACASGSGLLRAIEETGAVAVADVPGRRVRPQDILAAVRRVGTADAVVVLPGDADARMACEAAADLARDEGRDVRVVDTVSPVQALAALSVVDRDGPVEDVLARIAAVAAGVATGVVARADRQLATAAGPVDRGDLVAFEGRDIVAVGPDLTDVAARLVTVLRGRRDEPEALTLVLGADIDAGKGSSDAETLVEAIEAAHPDLEVSALVGDQPVYALFVGVE